jgi:hypothetical protein
MYMYALQIPIVLISFKKFMQPNAKKSQRWTISYAIGLYSEQPNSNFSKPNYEKIC